MNAVARVRRVSAKRVGILFIGVGEYYFRGRANETGNTRLSGGVLYIVPSQRMSVGESIRLSSIRAVRRSWVYSSRNNLPLGLRPSRRRTRLLLVDRE